MKRALALVLALALVMTLAVTGFAAGEADKAVASPTATVEDLVPVIVEVEQKTEFYAVPSEDVEKMSEAEQKTFADAKDALAEAVPEGMAVKYFFFLAKTEDATSESTAVVFNIEDYTQVVFMQFINGKWVELETVLNPDGTITVLKMVEGPVAVFVK